MYIECGSRRPGDGGKGFHTHTHTRRQTQWNNAGGFNDSDSEIHLSDDSAAAVAADYAELHQRGVQHKHIYLFIYGIPTTTTAAIRLQRA